MASYRSYQLKKEREARQEKFEEEMILSLSRKGMTETDIRTYMDNYRKQKKEREKAQWEKYLADAEMLHKKWILENTDENGIFVEPEYKFEFMNEDNSFD